MDMLKEILGLLVGCAVLACFSWMGNPADNNKGRKSPVLLMPRMVKIDGGTFQMGSDDHGSRGPVHTVRVSSFLMDRFEVTCSEYEEFCKATGHHSPFFWNRSGFHCGDAFPDHPVVGISWQDARSYAEWSHKRLPTEAEWEYAARGGLVANKYPHGDVLAPADGNYGNNLSGTTPVGSYAANGYGLYDMMGNVVEWVADRYGSDYYVRSPSDSPTGPDTGRFRVIRGGGWKSGPGCVGVSHRNALPSNWVDFNVGFRCVRDLPDNGQQPVSD